MKHLKAKLMASVGMLLVAIIMMSTASYAWFTISTAPEISNITANVTSNGNLEIALGANEPAKSAVGDSGKNGTWGNLIDLKSALQTSSGANTIILKPIRLSVTGSDLTPTLQYPVYGQDGRIATLADLHKFQASNSDTGAFSDVIGVNYQVSTYTEIVNGSSDVISCTNSDIYAFTVDFWLRSNSSPTDADGKVHVTLATSTNRVNNNDSDYETGLGSYIAGDTMDNITIAFRASSTDYMGWFVASRTNTVGTTTDIVLRKATHSDVDDRLVLDESDTNEAYIPLKQDVAMHVVMYVYLDGDELTNADAYLATTAIKMNVQFEVDGIERAMDATPNQENKRK